MGKSKSFHVLEKTSLSRRSFLQGLAAAGASAAIMGCSKDDNNDVISNGSIEPLFPQEKLYHAGCVHNCGTGVRCVSKIHVSNGRIVRVTSDDSDKDYEGHVRDKNQYNDSRALSCPKGRSYKYRVHHSGRLMYVLKQTKKRGDVTGFIRITPEQAMKEIAQKYRAIYTKYGAGAIYNIYATAASYGGTFSNPGPARNALTSVGSVRSAFSDYSYHQYNYANALTGHPDVAAPYTKKNNLGANFHAMAGGAIRNLVSWGSNVLSTNNSLSFGYIRSVEYLKSRGGRAYFIGPEFTDTGVTCHTDWVKLRNYTDAALIMAMMYYMLDNTFDKNGNIKANPMLDVDYIDTCVYGFFASPEYWVNEKTGEIITSKPSNEAGYRHALAVPIGKSLADYIMGNDGRLSKADYSSSKNYTAQKFKGNKRGGVSCSYNVTLNSATEYQYKKDFKTPKTPEWASRITGVPVETIIELAKLYADPESNILTEWCGGFQKQENGVMNVFALSALLCITKTFGKWGGGMYGPWASTILDAEGNSNVGSTGDVEFLDVSQITSGASGIEVTTPQITAPVSCTQWYNGVKLAFHDELKSGGYTAKHIPDWNFNGEDRYYNDDAGTKAGVVFEREKNGSIKTYRGDDGLDYYDYKGRSNTTGGEGNNPVFAGTRMIISAGGGIPVNQHANANDLTEMYKTLALSGSPTNPDTFCLVTFDVYLSPTARFADYVIPSTVALEAADTMNIGGENIYRPYIIKPKKDCKSGWEWAYLAYKAQAELGAFEGAKVDANAHLNYVRSTNGKYQSVEEIGKQVIEKVIKDPASRFFNKTLEQVYEEQYIPRKNTAELKTSEPIKPDLSGSIRSNLENYLKDPKKLLNEPFIFTNVNQTINEFKASVDSRWACNDDNTAGGIKNRTDNNNRPDFVGRMQVYNPTAVWDYEHVNSKYHGWLPAEKRGQKNQDKEGDAIVYPIPMYIAFEDCFKEAYDGFKNGKNADFFNRTGKSKLLTMSTTHDRFRVHSTHNENPLMRELNHRTWHGGWASCNDWKEYAVLPEKEPANNSNAGITGMISQAVQSKNKETASWHEIWIGEDDAKERGISDGDLCLVENPIGSVRVIARVTSRCMKGHINLHQGGWYDPNIFNLKDSFGNIIDEGGCANSLMASKPSRYDKGNAQQFAYVQISKLGFI